MTAIAAAVIHKLNKDPHGQSSVHQREAELELSEPVRKLVNAWVRALLHL